MKAKDGKHLAVKQKKSIFGRAEPKRTPVREAEPVRETTPVREEAPVSEVEPVREAELVRETAPVRKAEPEKKPVSKAAPEKTPIRSAEPDVTTGADKKAKTKPVAAPKAKKRRTWPIVLIAAVLVLALVMGGAYALLDSKLNKINYTPDKDNPMNTGKEFVVVRDNYEFKTDGLEQKESGSTMPTEDVFSDKDIINILLLGTDMKIPGTEDPGRCDATMVCSLNKATGEIKLIGFERTIGVPVPGYEDENLSYVFQYGGGDFMQETINKCFLVDLTGFVHVSYEMFPQVIDAMGGIDVELSLSEVYYMSEYLAYDPAKDTLHTGMCHLNGAAAYSYCRLRDPDDDWGRQERLRKAVSAAVGKLKDMSLLEINSMADEILPMISTNLTKAQIKSLIASAPKFINAEVTQKMVPEKEDSWTYLTGRGAWMLGCDFDKYSAQIREFIYGK